MTYKETLDWMFAQLPMYQQKGKIAFNAKLEKILKFSAHLNNPQVKFKSIHVAGTNGKGSSCHMLASILEEAGYKVGLYTSPHLKDFRERIRINGEPVKKRYVIDFVKENRIFFESNKLSFFEMTVGMSFAYFAEEKVDIAIVEVGLGGRFDSTNIIIPEVSLITNIGLDHTDILGNTLAKIAFEKAGIIKVGVPIIVSEEQDQTSSVFETVSSAKNAPLLFASQLKQPKYKTDLLGNYQSKNIKGVIAVLNSLKGIEVNLEDIRKGLEKVVVNTGLLGRWQTLGEAPKIICDTAHNKEGLLLVLDQVKKENYKALHIVLGFVKDKNLTEILPLFPIDANYYFCKPKIFRGLSVSELKSTASDYGLNGEGYDSVIQALKAASESANVNDFIFVGGSNFVVSEVV